MQRRTLANALALASLSCLVPQKATAQTLAPAKKESTAQPFRTVNAAEDGRRVIFFFDFACSFCAAYHEALTTFSQTVPKGIQTMFVPVINIVDLARKDEQILAAKIYYAALEVSTRQQMSRFLAAVYDSYPNSKSLRDKPMWSTALKAANIDRKKFGAALNSSSGDAQLHYAARKLIQYGIKSTPSVAVGGKYVITPDDVMGDQGMFFNILNGLASEIL